MAITVVQAKSNEATSATAVTVTISTTLGNQIIAMVRQGQNTTSTVSINDGTANIWNQTSSGYSDDSAGPSRGTIFYTENAAAITSVTFTWSGSLSTTVDAVVYEVNGLASSGTADGSVNSVNTGSVTSLTSGSLTTANANDILIYAVQVGTTITAVTPGAGYTIPTGGTSNRIGMQYQVVSSTQSGVTTSMSWTNAGNCSSVFAAFKAPSANVVLDDDSIPTFLIQGQGNVVSTWGIHG